MRYNLTPIIKAIKKKKQKITSVGEDGEKLEGWGIGKTV